MGNTSPEKGQTMFRALLMQKAKSQGINDPSFRISIDSGRSPTLSYTFKNPVTGQYSGIENVVIEWGDGTSTQLISEDDKNVTVEKLTHTYVRREGMADKNDQFRWKNTAIQFQYGYAISQRG